MFSRLISWVKSLFQKEESTPPTTTPEPTNPTEDNYPSNWGYIVPHEKTKPGASSPGGESEYAYGIKMTPLLNVPSATRDDGKSVEGAVAELVSQGVEYTLEDHKNAYNGQVSGLEILVIKGDTESEKEARRLIEIFKRAIPSIKLRGDNGVKFVNSGDNGYWNLSAAKANGAEVAILPEPFFLDNKDDYIEREKLAAIYNEFFGAALPQEEPVEDEEGQSYPEALWDEELFFSGYELGENIKKWLLPTMPNDIENYCPKYLSLPVEGKVAFWKYFLSCMAMKESGINPKTTYKENFKDSKGEYVLSTGLFQISVESVNGYNKFGTPKVAQDDLFIASVNLYCTLVILNRWLVRDGVISGTGNTGGARYWSVLRDNSNHRWIKSKCLEAWG